MALPKDLDNELLKTVQDFVNLEYDQLVQIGKECYENVVNQLLKTFNEEQACISIISLISSAIVADGKLTEKEIQFLTDVTGLSKEKIVENVYPLGTHQNAAKIANMICDCENNELADDAFVLAICLLAVDETVTRTEYAYIAELLDK